MNTELIRFIDSISRDKSIDKESVFTDLEAAMVSAIRKAYGEVEEVAVTIDRVAGTIEATADAERVVHYSPFEKTRIKALQQSVRNSRES